MNRKLLVIIPDRLSDLLRKGEITARYYNPGEMFNEVHILMTNDDEPEPAHIQKMVGNAKLYLYNLPLPSFLTSMGWQPFLVNGWVRRGVELIKSIGPELIRTHGNFLEGYIACEAKRRFGIPYVISLHGVWDRDCLTTQREKIVASFRSRYEKLSLQSANAVIAVYKPILRYATEFGAKRVRLIYNVVAGHIEKKTDYALLRPPRLITINRQLKEKNPENIIRAIKDIDCHYLIVGDGEYHDRLKRLVISIGCQDTVEFIRALPNDQICGMLKNFDMLVSHCDYWGISKTVIEASLAGLPTIINKHPIEPIPDYEGDWLLECDDTPEGYRSAIMQLLGDDRSRTDLAARAYAHACETFSPEMTEKSIVSLYREVLNDKLS